MVFEGVVSFGYFVVIFEGVVVLLDEYVCEVVLVVLFVFVDGFVCFCVVVVGCCCEYVVFG